MVFSAVVEARVAAGTRPHPVPGVLPIRMQQEQTALAVGTRPQQLVAGLGPARMQQAETALLGGSALARMQRVQTEPTLAERTGAHLVVEGLVLAALLPKMEQVQMEPPLAVRTRPDLLVEVLVQLVLEALLAVRTRPVLLVGALVPLPEAHKQSGQLLTHVPSFHV